MKKLKTLEGVSLKDGMIGLFDEDKYIVKSYSNPDTQCSSCDLDDKLDCCSVLCAPMSTGKLFILKRV